MSGGYGTVLVTGATGLVGAEVVRQLLAAGATVVGMDLSPRTETFGSLHEDERARLHVVAGDVTDLPFLLHTARKHDITSIVHMASLLAVASEHNPLQAIRVNCEGFVNIAETAVAVGAERLVFASSIAVFGFDRDNEGPCPNDAPRRPVDMYGHTKAMIEHIATLYRRRHRLSVVGLRFSVVYGVGKAATKDRGTATGFIGELIDKPAAGLPGRVGFDKPVIDWVHVEDAARSALCALTADAPPAVAYNITGERANTSRVAELVREIVPGAEIEVGAGLWAEVGVMHLDPDAAKADLGYVPALSLAEGLRRTIEALR